MKQRESNQKRKRTPGGDKFRKQTFGGSSKQNKSNDKIDFDDPDFWNKIEKELDFELLGNSSDQPENPRYSKSEKEQNSPGRKPFRNTNEKPYGERTRRSGEERSKQYKKEYNQDSNNNSFTRKRTNYITPRPESDFDLKQSIRETNYPDSNRKKYTGEHKNKPREKEFDKPFRRTESRDFDRVNEKRKYTPKENDTLKSNSTQDLIRLNRYISNSGVCSRREADELIRSGAIQVNGQTITELGYKVKRSDVVTYQGKTLVPEKKVYLLLNKPKDTLTTAHDPEGRRTVFHYIQGATRERIYPVGRLDRNTSGLLLFTNDGELADRLSHPSTEVEKVYHVVLDRNFEKADFEKLVAGIELEDGFIAPDSLSYTNNSQKELGIEIHSGRNRIVRRMFEHLGYKVVKLDRVLYAGLTKKRLERGAWRFLTNTEVRFLYSKTSPQKRGKNSPTAIEE